MPFFNFNAMIDGGDEPTPVRQSTPQPQVDRETDAELRRVANMRSMVQPTPTPTFDFAAFKQKEYSDYRSGERSSTAGDEQVRLAGMRQSEVTQKAAEAAAKAARRAQEDEELARDRAAAKQAQIDAANAMTQAQADLKAAREAQARAQRAAEEAAAEAARKQAEEEERRRRDQQSEEYDYSPSTVANTTPYVPVAPTPLTPSTIASQASNISPVTQTPPPPPVKTAPIDTILFDEEAVPIQIMSDLIFENIGGQELINIARNDTVNGQQVIYQPIKNLTSIQQQYNPNNILSVQSTSDKYFQNFSIKFDNKVPQAGTGPDGAHVYIDPQTGKLVVELVNLDTDEQVEVEITTGGTIYEAEL